MKKQRIEPGPGQESVWDYPRPPRLENCHNHIQVFFNGQLIADTKRAIRILETSHPPVYYLPPDDVRMEFLKTMPYETWCEWKGEARYYLVEVGDQQMKRAAWYYPNPKERFRLIKDYIAFYPSCMEACYVDGEKVLAQAGDFYGGWITSKIVGPFKGEPGTAGW